MAEIAEGGGGGHGKGKKRAKKSSTRVDMTPMVDLAFLLLTFFVLTSTFSKPKMLPLAYPAKTKEKDIKGPKMNNGITFLLSENKIFYYQGEYYFKGHVAADGSVTELKEVDFGPGEKGVRKLLGKLNNYVLVKKQGLDEKLKRKEINDSIYIATLDKLRGEKEALKVLIKTDEKALCKNFIDLVDELKIAEIGVIAPVDITPGELQLMKEKLKN